MAKQEASASSPKVVETLRFGHKKLKAPVTSKPKEPEVPEEVEEAEAEAEEAGAKEAEEAEEVSTGSFPEDETVAQIKEDLIPRRRQWESRYSYETRKATVARGIELWVEAWQVTEGIQARACKYLEMAQSNAPNLWSRLRLTRTRLNKLVAALALGAKEGR